MFSETIDRPLKWEVKIQPDIIPNGTSVMSSGVVLFTVGIEFPVESRVNGGFFRDCHEQMLLALVEVLIRKVGIYSSYWYLTKTHHALPALCSSQYLINKPTSFTTAPGTPRF